MQITNFIITLIIISSLHAGILVWSHSDISKDAKLNIASSNHSVTIRIKSPTRENIDFKNPKKQGQRKRREKIIKPSKQSTEKGHQGVLSPAKSLTKISMEYPYLSQVYEEEGTVALEVHISRQGEISKVLLIKSSGYDRLDTMAISKLKVATFSPATRHGKSVDSKLNLTFEFKLSEVHK